MQDKRFYRWIGAAAAALLCCAACSDDLLPETQLPAPDDTPQSGETGPSDEHFVISYSMDSEGAATRGSDPQAHRRIRSLDYYVYFKSGSLYKHRHIRGIDTSTHWPISDRNQMSWELRQDLQDTLPEGYDYRILFVANVSPTLFARTEDPQGGAPVMQRIVINEEQYSTARILLPREPLTDSTMFYMWEGEIDRSAQGIIPGSSVKQDNIVLRRIVAGTDFVRAVEAPTLMFPDNTDAHLCKALCEGFYKDYKARVAAQVDAQIEKFCGVVQDMVIKYTEKDGYPFYGENGEAARLNAFLRARKADITAEVERRLLTDYVARVKGEGQSGHLWRQADAWEDREVELVFSTDPARTQANALGFDRKAYALPDVVSCRRYTADRDGRFSVIGFAGGQFNHLTALRFTDPKGIAAPFEVQNTDFHYTEKQGLNTRYDVVCNPIAAIALRQGAVNEAAMTYTLDLRTLLGDREVTPGMTFDQLLEVTGNKTEGLYQGSYSLHGYMEWYVFHINHHSNKPRSFGNSFSEFKFPLTLPDLTETSSLKIDGMIEVTPSWQRTPRR